MEELRRMVEVEWKNEWGKIAMDETLVGFHGEVL